MTERQFIAMFRLAYLAEKAALLGFVKGYLREAGQCSRRDQAILQKVRDDFLSALVRAEAHKCEAPVVVPNPLRFVAQYHRIGRDGGGDAYSSRPAPYIRPSEMFRWNKVQPPIQPVLHQALPALGEIIAQTRHIAGGTAFSRAGQPFPNEKETS